ncbi:chemotaxis protein CheA [Maridesulfovibrio bastinii]|uniref:chemotaxis protein CheA n=1 Tax=Maridesulfovibrio bastinii TaxID=47157 RepID=UPI000407A55F|nr:chemotaxis protein CheW [Maridesulfovibrio bastinii]
MKESISAGIDQIQEEILSLESGGGNVDSVLQSLGLHKVRVNSAQIVALMDMLSDGITPITEELVSSLIAISEAHKKFLFSLAGILDKGSATVDTAAEREIVPEEEIPSEIEVEDKIEDAEESRPEQAEKTISTPETQVKAPEPQKKNSQAISSIRVSTQQLDSLIELVGKLMVTYAVIAQAETETTSKTTTTLSELDKIIRKLQSEVDQIRLVPLKQIFMPMHRLVQSTSQKVKKKIKFTVIGDDLALDKTIVECLNEPLVHLLRNALDHGVESPEDRAMSGKDETGNVTLSAWRKGDYAYIEVKDDGKGLDADKLMQKALERGIADPEKEYTQNEIYGFILKSGFSTASSVTDISGRGVGMDAVLTAVHNTLDGEIKIDSKLGQGSSFTICIPLSKSVNEGIVDSLITTVGTETFIIPSRDVMEVYEPCLKEFTDLPDGRETVSIRGKIYPLIRMHKVFDFPAPPAGSITKAILVKTGNSGAAILVDDVLRQQKAVVTGFTLPVNSIYHLPILGYGMMGEKDALVIDIETLINSMEESQE